MSVFRFGIMGAGKIARKFCEAVRLVPDCVVAAVASKSMARATALASEQGIPNAYEDYGAMLRWEKLDCVYIAATCDAHYELSMLCLEHRVPVLCEKAMFTSGAEAERCFARARELGVFAMEALWSRFLPAIRAAREWVAAGRIGRPVFAEMGIGFAAPRDMENRYFNPRLGGGAANDLTVYGCQLLTWVLDRPMDRAAIEAAPASTGVDATELVLLRLGEVPAVIKSSLMTPVEERLVVYGTAGRIVVPHAHYASEAVLCAADGSEIERFADTITENGFVYEIREVMRCVGEGKLESAVVPQASTLACARLFDRVRAALE